jgi:hypothetical protein
VAHPPPPSRLREPRPAAERALAWLYTGPLGHLWSTLSEIAIYWTRWALGSLRSRLSR